MAQPIGDDTIYNFNAATDKIDLIGFANIASFKDIPAFLLTSDASGNVFVTLGEGETITYCTAMSNRRRSTQTWIFCSTKTQ